MIKVLAVLNNDEWKIKCPRCDNWLLARVTICPVCYPQVNAKALQPISGGLFRPVEDVELVQQAIETAKANGHELEAVYPTERASIEAIVALRPARNHRNWELGETVDDLIQQNIQHGDPVPDQE